MAASTWAVPTVGCPAKGSSAPGVKMRRRRECFALSGGKTKTVSERFSSRAVACMISVSRPLASGNTARGFPP
jgi:hypothetical protein